MDRYICQVCGYIYDPTSGEPENGVAPETSFDDLPDDYRCPVCNATKEEFEKE